MAEKMPARASWVLRRLAAAPGAPNELRRAVSRPVWMIVATLLWVIGAVLPTLVIVPLCVGLVRGLVLGSSSELGGVPSWILLPMLAGWLVVVGAASRAYVRLFGSVDEVRAVRRPARALHHLPVVCARMVEEATAIRQDLGDVEAALLRAWTLANEVAQAPGDVRLVLEASGATLQPVHGLVAARASARVSKARMREALVRALASFEDALARPRAGAFR